MSKNENYLEAEDRTRNGKYESIHGKKVKVGKGTGQRTAKKARGAMSERERRMKEELGF